jgi:hypothetical protein
MLKYCIILFFPVQIFVSCNTDRKNQNLIQGGDQSVDSQSLNPRRLAENRAALDSDSIITYKDFALIDRGGQGSGALNSLLKKGFILRRDTIASTIKESLFVKPGTGDMLELLNNNDTDGSISFIINYYTKNNSNYLSILNSIDHQQYKFDSRNKRYEYSIGTYEDVYIFPLSTISKDSRTYFLIKYLHYMGKELSSPPTQK